MVFPLDIVAATHEPTFFAFLAIVVGEGMDCVRFGYLRKDGLTGGGGQGARRRLRNAQVDIPRWRRH